MCKVYAYLVLTHTYFEWHMKQRLGSDQRDSGDIRRVDRKRKRRKGEGQEKVNRKGRESTGGG